MSPRGREGLPPSRGPSGFPARLKRSLKAVTPAGAVPSRRGERHALRHVPCARTRQAGAAFPSGPGESSPLGPASPGRRIARAPGCRPACTGPIPPQRGSRVPRRSKGHPSRISEGRRKPHQPTRSAPARSRTLSAALSAEAGDPPGSRGCLLRSAGRPLPPLRLACFCPRRRGVPDAPPKGPTPSRSFRSHPQRMRVHPPAETPGERLAPEKRRRVVSHRGARSAVPVGSTEARPSPPLAVCRKSHRFTPASGA